jgi:hypothetical protein
MSNKSNLESNFIEFFLQLITIDGLIIRLKGIV